MKKLLREFRDFITTGNVIDLSVAVLLGTAIGAVVSGFTQNIMMPIVGEFTGGMDFSDLKFVLSEAVAGADGKILTPENAVYYGKWINSLIDLIIVGFVLFLIVKLYTKVKDIGTAEEPAEEAEETVPAPTQEELLGGILEELKQLNAKK